jgi:enediyne biosynthesis protein E4
MTRRNTICLALASVILLADVVMSSAQLKFTDVTATSGVRHQYEVHEGMFGGGAAVLDYNNDGFEDVYITSGMSNDVLYRNNGNGTFTNVVSDVGIRTTDFVTEGVAAADVNRDGWIDLFVTTITRRDTTQVIPRAENLLFLNNGNGTFRDATDEFRLRRLISFSMGASFGDINRDGFPDLFIGNYFRNYEGTLKFINDATIVNANQTSEPYLLINEAGRYFRNATEEYKVRFKGFGFGGVFTDFDNDRDLDLYINNDFGYKAKPNVLLRNEFPDNEFTDISKASGMDVGINAMGTAVTDFDNNGLLDYYITNIRFNRFMVNRGDGLFTDMSKQVGMDYISVSWGANFADFDHDGDEDLFVANGDLNPNDVPMADYFFEHKGTTFEEIAPSLGVNDYGVGRGSVVFDMDNDGDLDLLVVNQKPVYEYPVESVTRLFRNDRENGNWLKIKLRGTQSDLQGIGARVAVVAGGKTVVREVHGGSSHLSQNSTIVHVGLGQISSIDSLRVSWIGGEDQVFTNVPVNRLMEITESKKTSGGISLFRYAVGASIFIGLVLVIWVQLSRRSRRSEVVKKH